MHDEMKPKMPVDDSEARMARSELYRAAKYSMKLFEMIHEGQELEGWVSAKITKSADYLDSVYHYMEYQVKFGQGGTATSLDDITSDATVVVKGEVSEEDDEQKMKESYEQKLQALLEGAMKKVKGKKAEDKKDEKMDEAKFQASGVRATDKKKGKVDKTERKVYFVKLEKDNKVKGVTTQAEEGESQGEVRDRVKRENMGWTVVSIREKATMDESKDEDAKKADEEKRKKEEKKKKIAKVIDEAPTFSGGAPAAPMPQSKIGGPKFSGGGGYTGQGTPANQAAKAQAAGAKPAASGSQWWQSLGKDDLAVAMIGLRQRIAWDDRILAQDTSNAEKMLADMQKDWDQQYPGENYDQIGQAAAAKMSAAELLKKQKAQTLGGKIKTAASNVAGAVKKVFQDVHTEAKKPDANKDGIPDYAQDGKGSKDLGKGKGGDKKDGKKGMSPAQEKFFGKKNESVKESVMESAELTDILKLAGRKPING